VSVDVSDLDIGDSIKLSTIELPANVKMISEGSSLCVEVGMPGAAESEYEDEAEQPEVAVEAEAEA
jgi:hypothetical protein